LGCGVGTTADEAGGARPAHGGGGCCSVKRWIKSGEGSLTTRRRAGEGLGGGDGAPEEIEAAAELRAAVDPRCGGACRGGERKGGTGE
jgi:hypothetical protein